MALQSPDESMGPSSRDHIIGDVGGFASAKRPTIPFRRLPVLHSFGPLPSAILATERKQRQKDAAELPVLNPATHPDRDPEPVRSFSTFTQDLHRIADWLKACEVNTVAM